MILQGLIENSTIFIFCAVLKLQPIRLPGDSIIHLVYAEKMFWMYKLSVFFPYNICFWDFHQKIKPVRIWDSSKHFNEAKTLKTYFKYEMFRKWNFHVQNTRNTLTQHVLMQITIKGESNQNKNDDPRLILVNADQHLKAWIKPFYTLVMSC